jgi:hypothetical protein
VAKPRPISLPIRWRRVARLAAIPLPSRFPPECPRGLCPSRR